MAVWLFPNKAMTYGKLQPQKGKEGKPNDPWNIHLSFDEMTWSINEGVFTLLAFASSATGASIMKDHQDKIKFPFPVKIQVPVEGATVGIQCLIKVLQSKAPGEGKFWSGFIAANDENAFASAIASGKKADGSEMSEADIANFAGQFCGVMETQQSKLTPELVAEMMKLEVGGKGGYSKAETLAERIATREAKLREYLLLKPEDKFPEIVKSVQEMAALYPCTVDLLNLLLQ